ncbi:MAG: hypothetical protein ACO3JL_05990, partial [Myxococcota bacterium]
MTAAPMKSAESLDMRTHLLTVGASALFGSLLLLTEPSPKCIFREASDGEGGDDGNGPRARGTRLLSLQGEVAATDASAGVLTVRLASGSEEVHGTPWQVERHRVGDQVTLTLRHYGDQRWLWPLTIRPPVMLNVQGTITGPIERIDANAARVRLGGKVILAHPEQLRAFSLALNECTEKAFC